MIKPLWGICGILASKKGVMCVLILACTTTAAILGHVDGTGFAAAMSVIGTVFCWTTHKESIAQLQFGNKNG